MLEAVLFRHDISTSLRAQGKLFKHGGRYFLLAVPPLIILAVPCIILLGQLNFFFGSAPATPSEPLLVSVRVENPDDVYGVEVLVPDEFQAEVSHPVRVREERETFFRVTPTKGGDVPLVVRTSSGDEVTDHVIVGERSAGFTAQNYASWWLGWLYPNFAVLPKGVEFISVSYAPAYYSLFGIETHWLLFFFLVSLVSGLVAAKLFRIEI